MRHNNLTHLILGILCCCEQMTWTSHTFFPNLPHTHTHTLTQTRSPDEDVLLLGSSSLQTRTAGLTKSRVAVTDTVDLTHREISWLRLISSLSFPFPLSVCQSFSASYTLSVPLSIILPYFVLSPLKHIRLNLRLQWLQMSLKYSFILNKNHWDNILLSS